MAPPTAIAEQHTAPVRSWNDIPGWFPWLDHAAFTAVLEAQQGQPGDLVELGAYLGKSAVVIGAHLQVGERFVVVDLFGTDELLGTDSSVSENRHEVIGSYSNLTRDQFEANYAAVHAGVLPEIVHGLSSSVVDHVGPDTCRFVHIDASHLYDQVCIDIENTRSILKPGGVVVFDDFRSGHTPGVAAAVWDAVLHGGLIPFAITPQKLYAVYDDPAPYLSAITGLAQHDARLSTARSRVADHEFLRINYAKAHLNAQKARRARESAQIRHADVATQRQVVAAALQAQHEQMRQLPVSRRILRTIARDYAPPSMTRWAIARRNRRRNR